VSKVGAPTLTLKPPAAPLYVARRGIRSVREVALPSGSRYPEHLLQATRDCLWHLRTFIAPWRTSSISVACEDGVTL